MSDSKNTEKKRTGNMSAGMTTMGSGEKAKDAKQTMRKLMQCFVPFKVGLIFITLFAVIGTVFMIVGPKILGQALTELSTGFFGQLSGGAGIDFDKIAGILVMLTVLYVASLIFSSIQGFLMSGVSQKMTYDLRKQIIEKTNRMPMGYFDQRNHGETLSLITNDIDTIGISLNQSATQIVTSFVTVVGILVMMLSIDWAMTLISLIVLPISIVVVSIVVKGSQKYFRRQQESLGHVNSQVEEIFGAHTVVRVFNAEQKEQQVFERENQALYQAGWKAQFMSGIMFPIMFFVGNLGFIAVAISGGLFAAAGRIETGFILTFIQYTRIFTQSINQLAQSSTMIQSTLAAAERVFEFLDLPEEVQTVKNPVKLQSVQGAVDFDHVHFGYVPGQTIIHDFSTQIKPGQKIAIVGPTGAGKSTIVKLLMRFYDVDTGDIFVDGHKISAFDQNDLRRMFGMVLQDTWLFHGTIMENIRYGKLDATDQEVKAAAKATYCDHFIKTLPGGYDMVLNEETSNVSQGQKQLLTIARALLADPKILILDEATSSVDTRTEVRIQKAMNILMEGRTSFIIAHRLSTIRDADKILVMRDGDIVEQGSHDQLLEQQGFYHSLYNAQFKVG